MNLYRYLISPQLLRADPFPINHPDIRDSSLEFPATEEKKTALVAELGAFAVPRMESLVVYLIATIQVPAPARYVVEEYRIRPTPRTFTLIQG